MRKDACSGTSRMTKPALLAMMGYSKFVQATFSDPTLTDQKMDAVMKALSQNGGDYNKTSVVLGVKASSLKRWVQSWSQTSTPNSESTSPNRTRGFYEKIKNPWSITSFDPTKREVCIDIDARVGTNHLSYTIPEQRPADY
jgi:hypothetical protein